MAVSPSAGGARAPDVETDVIVVGAGLSGLVCARRLAAAGARVLVLEARDRVGGRLHTGRIGDAMIDLGGQWMTPGQPRLVTLAHELGVATELHDRIGAVLVDEPGGIVRALRTAFAQWRAMRRIENLMRDAGDVSGTVSALDRQSLGEWLAREVGNPLARERIALHADLVFATEPARLSLLYYLRVMRATRGFRPEGREELRFVGGAQQLALRLAEQLGDRVRLATAVTAIEQTPTAIHVRANAGQHTSKRVVLALPPPLVRGIYVSLPPPARAYAEAAFAGRVIKCFAAFATPSWRERGLSGESFHPRGAVRATVEASSDPPVLLAFVVGAEAVRFAARPADERRAAVLAVLAPMCSEPPLDYLEIDWGADPWSGGCVPALPPGALSAGARWRDPHDRIHIAGTESAAQWPGYMEGAIEAGERAASEVLAAL